MHLTQGAFLTFPPKNEQHSSGFEKHRQPFALRSYFANDQLGKGQNCWENSLFDRACRRFQYLDHGNLQYYDASCN